MKQNKDIIFYMGYCLYVKSSGDYTWGAIKRGTE